MQGRGKGLLGALAGLLVAVLASACDQEPSFKENYNGSGRTKSGDAVADSGIAQHPGDESTTGDKPGTDAADGTDAGSDGADAASDGTDATADGGTDGAPQPKTMTRSMTFASDKTMASTVTKNLDDPYLSQDITLLRTYTDKSRTQNQVTRPVLTDNFDQGTSGAATYETFAQVANRPLDILVIVDNSGSMTEEQQNLSGKLQPLLGFVADTDWQIGIATTDPGQTCLRKLVKKGDANAMQAFSDGVTAGINGSGNERGVLQAVRSLSGTCLASPWIRADSTVAVLIVSDEDNCSDGTECPGKDYANGSYLYDYLASNRVPGQNARVYGIYWDPSQPKSACPTGENQAKIYAQLVSQTGGTSGSICDADYTATLAAVSKNIQTVLTSKFTLKFAPEPGSLHVFQNNVETTNFTVTGKVVNINPAPADGTTVKIAYKYGATPIKTSFALRYKPLPNKVAVTVNGATADPSTYTVNTATPAVDFATAPAELAKVVVTYTRDVPLTTVFTMGDTIKVDSMRVTVDNGSITNFTVNNSAGTVTFATPPAESAAIKFEYVAVGNPILAYPFSAPYGAPVDLAAFDSQTKAAVGVAYVGGNAIISALDYVEGRKVTLRYDNVARQKFDVVLPNVPMAGSVSAVGGGQTCASPADVKVNGTTVSVDDCGFADDVASVEIRYTFIVESYQDFTFAVDRLPAAGDFQEWSVWVNGVQTTDFSRAGNVIHMASPLPSGATVKIQLLQVDK